VKQVGRELGVRYVAERFRRQAGNADVVRQELEREKGVRLSLRTVEREVRHLRRELPPMISRQSAPAWNCAASISSA
jgi:hypothetical protein